LPDWEPEQDLETEMIESLTIGIGGIVSLLLIWVLVQSGWRKIFAEHISDEDVMAGRTQCGNCGCTTVCDRHGNELNEKLDLKN
jgi:hypothetical protein